MGLRPGDWVHRNLLWRTQAPILFLSLALDGGTPNMHRICISLVSEACYVRCGVDGPSLVAPGSLTGWPRLPWLGFGCSVGLAGMDGVESQGITLDWGRQVAATPAHKCPSPRKEKRVRTDEVTRDCVKRSPFFSTALHTVCSVCNLLLPEFQRLSWIKC